MEIRSKLPETGTTIFTVMSGLATHYNAVNLGQGFPDYPMSEELTGLVDKAMKDGFNQYAPMPGWMPLRETIAQKIYSLYNNKVSADKEITITPGGTYAIYSALTTILHPGDEVIIMQPNYDSYVPNVQVNGAIPVLIDLDLPHYSVNWAKVRAAITAKTKAVILNSPHNPTGSILSAEDIGQLRNIVDGTGIFIISDEVYEHIIFDGEPHRSILRYPDLYDRSFVCFSFGKVYHCTGWKMGYCVAPPSLMSEFRKVHQFNAFSTNSPMQVALGEYLQNSETYNSLSSFFQRKRDHFTDLMKATGFSLFNSAGSYFICASYEKINDEPDKD
ncbi:MAG: aminotransferase class I/II-fold pyridoxal phosphate-dependent enzyme, partial [Chitinophagaceae bacterium]|nr:aminotransferase class I/II-fold pyridoxal phosphate-dependent enzyme [Chitinophagaceae bacterium]